MLTITRIAGQAINIYAGRERIVARVVRIAGDRVRITIEAADDVCIVREEIDEGVGTHELGADVSPHLIEQLEGVTLAERELLLAGEFEERQEQAA